MSILTPPLSPSSEIKMQLHKPSSPRTSILTPPYTPELKSSDFDRLSIASSSSDTAKGESSRLLSDNELSYFLPSRQDGVNDMYLQHRLTCPAGLMERERVLALWSYQLARHPLLASHLQVDSYEGVSFVYPNPSRLSQAIMQAEDRFCHLGAEDADIDVMDSYLNGPRTLASDRLAMLIIADKSTHFEVMLCATHFLGDGMALHTFMNEFYTLLGSDRSTDDFYQLIREEITNATGIPPSLEDRMPAVGNGGRLAHAIGKVDSNRNDARLIGGQAFPANSTKLPRHTVVPTFAYSVDETKTILGRCKANGSTIAHAMFALCNIAWSRRTQSKVDPCLIYSALNLRPNMLPSTSAESFFHLAVGYFNIVLPCLLPADLSTSELFWHRARLTKAQTVKAVKSQFVVARSRNTNRVRRERAVKWAKIDDEEAAAKTASAGLGLGIVEPKRAAPEKVAGSVIPEPKIAPVRAEKGTPETISTSPKPAASPAALPVASQRALMGVSMLGNLDGMYNHKAFGEVQLQSLTTGSRQRQGGLLLFAYTFAGKLWMSLGYDMNGFAPGAIEGFWDEVQSLAKEVLL